MSRDFGDGVNYMSAPAPLLVYDVTLSTTTEAYGVADSPNVGGGTGGWVPDSTTASNRLGTVTLLAGRRYRCRIELTVDPLDVPISWQWGLAQAGPPGPSWQLPHDSFDTYPTPPSNNPNTFDDITFVPLVNQTGCLVMNKSGFAHGVRGVTAHLRIWDST